jgi:hypothetical protein
VPGGEPDFAPSFRLATSPRRLRLRDATSGKPGGDVGEAALDRTSGPSAIFLGACTGQKVLKTGGPANDSNASFVSWYIKLVIRTEY